MILYNVITKYLRIALFQVMLCFLKVVVHESSILRGPMGWRGAGVALLGGYDAHY
jgi:hypothetical protein